MMPISGHLGCNYAVTFCNSI